MKSSKKCPKCSGTEIEPMELNSNVFIHFPTFYLGDRITPRLYICLKCGFSECWIDSSQDLVDVRKFAQAKDTAGKSASGKTATGIKRTKK